MLHVDTRGAGLGRGARKLLRRLRDEESISLGELSGADLGVLGATGYPVCSGELRSTWWGLSEQRRQQLANINTLLMLRRGLVEDLPRSGDLESLTAEAWYPMSAELNVLLGARQQPGFICATQHGLAAPSVTYFRTWGRFDPFAGYGAFVKETPEWAGSRGALAASPDPLNARFSYQLVSPSRALHELALWATAPCVEGGRQPYPARSICVFREPQQSYRDSFELIIRSTAEQVHVEFVHDAGEPPGIIDLDPDQLILLLDELLAQGSV